MNNTYFTKRNYVLYSLLGLFMTSCIQEPVQNGLGGYVSDEDYQAQFVDNDVDIKIEDGIEIDTVQVDI